MAEPSSSSSSSAASSPREPATEGSDRPSSQLKKSSASLLDEGMIQKMLEEGKAFTRQFVCELPPLPVKQPIGDPAVYDTDAEDKLVSCRSISTYPLFPDGRCVQKKVFLLGFVSWSFVSRGAWLLGLRERHVSILHQCLSFINTQWSSFVIFTT